MKKFFFRGLTIVLPFILAIALIFMALKFLYTSVGDPIGKLAHYLISPETEFTLLWGILGFIIAFILVFILGVLVATFIGNKIYSLLEQLANKMPLLKSIYPITKQLSSFVIPSDQKKVEFKKPVLISFPSNGIHSIGFVTADDLRFLDQDKVCVFVPTSPTPFSGFTVFVSRTDIKELPITVEEAMMIIVSCGMVTPTKKAVEKR